MYPGASEGTEQFRNKVPIKRNLLYSSVTPKQAPSMKSCELRLFLVNKTGSCKACFPYTHTHTHRACAVQAEADWVSTSHI